MSAIGAAREPRIRRSRDAARELILDAAERRLIADGPAGVRVQLVANDVGMSDAAVHYHFGSRDGLVDALLRRAGRRLRSELATAAGEQLSTLDVRKLSRGFRRTYDERQYARLTAWLVLDGWRPSGSSMLRPLVEAIHGARVAHAQEVGVAEPAFEDTQFTLFLLNAVHWADALIGGSLRRMVGLSNDHATATRFFDWVDDLLAAHLRGATAPR
jgi:AcrR family transcriptional regulator